MAPILCTDEHAGHLCALLVSLSSGQLSIEISWRPFVSHEASEVGSPIASGQNG
jgi:hypothetical protein